MENTIPKKIHFCWFGGNPKSDIILRCIESWKKYLPDYELIEWNESNFDIHVCKYVEEAYEKKKWAFVSDYCRIWALNTYGGVYFDTDVEIVKDPKDIFLSPAVGFESQNAVNPGLVMACAKNDWLCTEMLREYNEDSYILPDGSNNYRTICDRMTRFLAEKGLRLDNSLQHVEGYTVYPTEYFNPYNPKKDRFDVTEKTVTLHRFLASWQTDDSHKITKDLSFKGKVFVLFVKLFGINGARKIRSFIKHPFKK